jgi:hypothetical protein
MEVKIKMPRVADVLASWGGWEFKSDFGKWVHAGQSEWFEFPQGKFHPLHGRGLCACLPFVFQRPISSHENAR